MSRPAAPLAPPAEILAELREALGGEFGAMSDRVMRARYFEDARAYVLTVFVLAFRRLFDEWVRLCRTRDYMHHDRAIYAMAKGFMQDRHLRSDYVDELRCIYEKVVYTGKRLGSNDVACVARMFAQTGRDEYRDVLRGSRFPRPAASSNNSFCSTYSRSCPYYFEWMLRPFVRDARGRWLGFWGGPIGDARWVDRDELQRVP